MFEGSTLARLLEVAVGQHGFITPDTAASAGVDPARLPVMLARGQLERWGRGLYRIPQLPIGKYDHLAAAVMRVGHGAVVSHALLHLSHNCRFLICYAIPLSHWEPNDPHHPT